MSDLIPVVAPQALPPPALLQPVQDAPAGVFASLLSADGAAVPMQAAESAAIVPGAAVPLLAPVPSPPDTGAAAAIQSSLLRLPGAVIDPGGKPLPLAGNGLPLPLNPPSLPAARSVITPVVPGAGTGNPIASDAPTELTARLWSATTTAPEPVPRPGEPIAMGPSVEETAGNRLGAALPNARAIWAATGTPATLPAANAIPTELPANRPAPPDLPLPVEPPGLQPRWASLRTELKIRATGDTGPVRPAALLPEAQAMLTVNSVRPDAPAAVATAIMPLVPVTPQAAGVQLAAMPLQLNAGPTDGQHNWSAALGQRMLLLVANGMDGARLQLSPANLGALDIRIRLDDDRAQVSFNVQHPATREALESALPRLREMFAAQGMELIHADVQGGESGERQPGASTGTDSSVLPLTPPPRSSDQPTGYRPAMHSRHALDVYA